MPTSKLTTFLAIGKSQKYPDFLVRETNRRVSIKQNYWKLHVILMKSKVILDNKVGLSGKHGTIKQIHRIVNKIKKGLVYTALPLNKVLIYRASL